MPTISETTKRWDTKGWRLDGDFMGYQKNAPKKDVSGFFWLKNDNKSLRSIEEKINVPGNSAGDLILDG